MVFRRKSPAITKCETKTQWLAAIEVFLLMIMIGGNLGWMSPFLGRLNRPDPPFEATREEMSWVASMGYMSRTLAIITGCVAANYFGSKTSIHVCGGCYFACAWISLICANSIKIVLISQFCCGLGMGTVMCTFPMYVGEIVNHKIRGSVVSFVMNGLMIGLLYGNLMGSHLNPWVFGAINLIMTAIYLITFSFFPSTPHHLINCDKLEKAKESLQYYNSDQDVNEEFSKLQDFIKSSPRVSFLESVRKMKDPINLKTLVMINVVYSIVRISGTFAIIEYLEVILMAGKIEIILPSTMVTIINGVAFPSSWVAVAIGDKFGRVTMLLYSCVIFCAAFFVWGLSFHLLELGFSPSYLQWLVIVSTLVFRINLSVGLNPIVQVLMSEVFAPNVKSVSLCFCNITASVCIFISVKNFQFMADHMTYKYLFYFYAGLVLAVGVYTKLCIPETKGKTLQEIQEIFSKSNVVKTKIIAPQGHVNIVNDTDKMCNRVIDVTKL